MADMASEMPLTISSPSFSQVWPFLCATTAPEPEEQTSREQKDRLGLLAYAIQVPKQLRNAETTHFHITIDGQVIEAEGVKLYVVNSGMMGKGVRISHEFSVDDGYLDVFVLGRDALSIMAAETRILKMRESPLSRLKCWRGQSIHCLLYTSPSPRDRTRSRMPSSA